MANATQNPATGDHSGHWYTKVEKSGLYEFTTGGKFVDRNIDLDIPKAEETLTGSASATIANVVVGNKSGNNYPITGSADITGSATATINTKGFTDEASYSGSISGTVNLDSSITAAAASVAMSGTATKPTIAKESTTNVSSSAITTTKPTSGYYVGVKATAPATTITGTPSITAAGYLGAASEITASGSTTAKSGDAYYVPITSSSLGNAAKTGVTYTENTTVTIPSKGALYIEGGYIPPTMITLDQMLDGKTDTAGTLAKHILDGYVAYSVDGEKLTGGMPDNGALGTTITTQNGTYTIPAGYTTGGTVTATLPTQELPTEAVASTSDAIKGTVSRSTADQYLVIPTGYNGSQVAYKISATPNAGAATTVPTAVTTAATVGTTATSGYYTVTNTIGATSSHASAGWVGTTAETGSKSIQVGKILAGSITNNTSGGTSSGTINAGAQIKISKGYYHSDVYYQAQDAGGAAGYTPITGSLTTSIDTGYTAPTLVNSKTSGKSYVTISGNGSAETGKIYNGTATAKTQYMEVYSGTFTIT